MSGVFDVRFFWEVFVTLLVITDPPGVVPPFLGLTRGLPSRVRNRLAWQAAVVAFGVIVAFALFGQSILAYLGVELPALQGAGGLLLLLVALQLLTGAMAEPTEAERLKANVAFVPLGTPLLERSHQHLQPLDLAQEVCEQSGASLRNVARILQVHTDLADFLPACRVWQRRLPGLPLPISAVRVPAPLIVPGCSVGLDLWVYAP